MPDTPLPDLRLDPRRPMRSRQREGMPLALWVSGGLHLLALALLLFVQKVAPPAPPPPEPSFDIVFQGAPTPVKGAPKPGKYTEIPEGPTSARPVPTPPRPSPPPSPPAPPRVNIVPPEYAEEFEPPPPQAQAEPVPHPAPRTEHRRVHRQSQRNNPFAHPMQFSFAPASPPMMHQGLRNSRSLDLAMGPVIAGGTIHDAVPHVSSPGASSDYLEGISEYIETHKFYPEQAAEAGEEGTSVISVTIARDGRVKDVHLVESAGSNWLDMGWISLFRGHQFAPFPDDMKEKERTFTMSMDYEIIYGHQQ